MAFAFVVDGTDELRGHRECRVVLRHQGLGEEAHYLLARKGVLQSLQQEVTDHALCLGHEGVEGVGEGEIGVPGALECQQTDLGAIAVGDDRSAAGRRSFSAAVRRCVYMDMTHTRMPCREGCH